MSMNEARPVKPGFFFSEIPRRALTAAIATIALIAAIVSSHRLETDLSERVRFLPPPDLRHFHFGFAEATADLLWVRVLQDFDACESAKEDGHCKASWVYRMLDLITDLAPAFRRPYATGALALSVLVDDVTGASKLFDKSVAAFPNDWPILSRAAYQALYEEKNDAKAAALMERAAKAGAPQWYYSLAMRLYDKSGQAEAGRQLLQMLKNDPSLPPEILERIEARLSQGAN